MGALFTFFICILTGKQDKVFFIENQQERGDRERKVKRKVRALGLRAPFVIFTATDTCVPWLPLLYFEFTS